MLCSGFDALLAILAPADFLVPVKGHPTNFTWVSEVLLQLLTWHPRGNDQGKVKKGILIKPSIRTN